MVPACLSHKFHLLTTDNRMLYHIRETISFDGMMYNIESTMTYLRTIFTHDLIEPEYYNAIMSVLVELRAGYPYEADEFINMPDGGYGTLDRFFFEHGVEVHGGREVPIDLTTEDEIEEFEPRVLDFTGPEDDNMTVIDDDLISEVTFFSAIDEIDIMNDDIGDWETEYDM
jgi:hypothetical protein